MNAVYSAILLLLLDGVYSYSKFGRKCDDIGCASNEECVMASKPCSYFDRKDECGEYPTCKRVDNGARTCNTYVCPPSKVCKMDGGIPKCFDDSSKIGKVPLYDTSNLNNKYEGHGAQSQPSAPSGNYNPSAPVASGGSLYPNIGGANGYQGGYNNPGYQQPAGGVQRPMGNYGGYQQPSNTYGGYPSSGSYPGTNNNRPAGGYNQQGAGGYYPGGYTGQGGYNRPQQQPGGYGAYGSNAGYGNNGYGTKGNTGSSFTDSLKDALKKIGILIIVSHCISQNYWR
ncbi:FHA domain-containing protein FhaA isoform X2 [Coccinella septempunctata]|uniref:FHA domain-containing protein FhaA isoform X2 n=1 Tax=Coccinella septempunctata TaxID=41139 RepID=UPI001D062EF8|nr:FHA domain-containing protein FhaA isoform X2 [Coccinella septempunctata]